MPKKLKTYRTSLGFFELAIAAPSMKAALEAWGSKSNLFHQGFAKETDDPAIVAATSARPGVILKRAVGSNDIFTEHAALPRNLGERAAQQTPIKAMQAGKDQRPPKTDDRTTIAAAVAFEREEKGANERARRNWQRWKNNARSANWQSRMPKLRWKQPSAPMKPKSRRSKTPAPHSIDSRRRRLPDGKNRVQNSKRL